MGHSRSHPSRTDNKTKQQINCNNNYAPERSTNRHSRINNRPVPYRLKTAKSHQQSLLERMRTHEPNLPPVASVIEEGDYALPKDYVPAGDNSSSSSFPSILERLVLPPSPSEPVKGSRPQRVFKTDLAKAIRQDNLARGLRFSGGIKASAYEEFKHTRADVASVIGDQLGLLGPVSANPNYLFEESKESNQYAAEFLSSAFSESALRKLFVDTHHEKKSAPSVPSCISFTAAELSEKKLCFVALSLTANNKLLRRQLEKFTKIYNSKISHCEFIFVFTGSPAFSEDLVAISDFVDTRDVVTKPCAERVVGKELETWYETHGRGFRVKGHTSCIGYPIVNNKDYKGIIKAAWLRPGELKIELAGGLYTRAIPCCDNCINGKDAILLTWAEAQARGQARLNLKTSAKAITDFSPSPSLFSSSSSSLDLPKEEVVGAAINLTCA